MTYFAVFAFGEFLRQIQFFFDFFDNTATSYFHFSFESASIVAE